MCLFAYVILSCNRPEIFCWEALEFYRSGFGNDIKAFSSLGDGTKDGECGGSLIGSREQKGDHAFPSLDPSDLRVIHPGLYGPSLAATNNIPNH